MFKDVMNYAELSRWAETGMLIFFACFIAVTIWALTRPRKQVEEWAAIPLSGGRRRNRDASPHAEDDIHD